MKIRTTVSCFLAIAIPAFLARADDGSVKAAPRTPDYCKLGNVIGAKVSISPSAEAVEEATKDGEVAKRPTGKIANLLLDSCDGTERWAVITFDKTLGLGGKTVAVPSDQLTWNHDHKCFDLVQSDEQLKALPSFDVDAARKDGLDRCCGDLKEYWPSSEVDPHHSSSAAGQDRDLADHPRQLDDESKNGDTGSAECPPLKVDGKTLACAAPQLIVASDLDGCEMFGHGEKFGKISETIVDRANRSVRYFVVSHGGTLGVGATKFLIPVRAICLHKSGGDLAYSADRSVADLEAGVKYKEPQDGVLDFELARRADELFAKDIKKHCDKIHQ